MEINAKECLDELTKEGKEITINIKINDSEKASRLMGTMYGYHSDEFGVSVESWGFWDVQKANSLRITAMNKEVSRHQEAMQSLTYKSDLDYLSEDKEANN